MKTHILIKLSVILLILAAFPLLGADNSNNKIEILKPTIYPDTAENKTLVTDLIDSVSILTERIYSNYLEISNSTPNSRRNAEYSLAINYVFDPGGSVLQMTMTHKDSEKSNSFNIMGTIENDTPIYLARSIMYLWAGFNNYFADSLESRPIFIESLKTSYIQGTVIPETPTMLMPMDLAVKPNGNFIGAFSMLSVEFDSNFNIISQPGRSLYEAGSYTSAAGVAVTPGGTIFLKPSMGRDIYRFSEGSDIGEKWRTGMDLYGPFMSMPDGSIIVVDIQKKKTLNIYNRKKTELDLFTSPYSYISTIALGPEGNIWVYDITEQRIRIHTPEGELLDSIIPVIDTSSGMSPSALSVYNDGSFVIYYSTGHLHSFTREGIPIWGISNFIGLEGSEGLPMSGKVAVDSSKGLIYIADIMGQQILQLQDRAFISRHSLVDAERDILKNLNKNYFENSTIESIAQKADFYEKAGALELANQIWEQILDLDPDYDPAYDRYDDLQIKIMTMNAETMKAKTIEKLQKLGPESARNDYRKTIQLYEQILAMDPSNSEVKTNRQYLQELFNSGGSESNQIVPFTVEALNVDNLFPSLMQNYQHTSVGKVKIKNISTKDINNIKIDLFIKQFMDFPVVSEKILIVKPSESVEIDLNLLFNQEVLKLEEDLQVQVKLDISYSFEGKNSSSEETSIVTLYRRSAMQWDDSGKLSSFITPNENIIEQFSHRVISNLAFNYDFEFTDKFARAMRITNSLGAYGINYIEDPASPITEILGNSEAVDTVRFARKTLFIRSGDCDDTTALLASLLESSGIDTAIMTSPGHVFMAFNSEEPVSNRWMYESELVSVIPYNGTLWVPIETTILGKGFFTAWEVASRELRNYESKGEIEFLALKDQRKLYPPLPLGQSFYQVLEPKDQAISSFDKISAEEMRNELYYNNIDNLNRDVGLASSRRKSAIQNRLGILHVRFNNYKEAEKVFTSINKEQPEYISAYINLANLYRIQEKTSTAIGLLESAIEKAPESTAVNLVLAQCYYEESDFSKAGRLFADVNDKDPELALKFAYLSTPGGGRDTISRAAGAGEDQPIFWDSED
jgi:tetratricopeptide (TPR) repeat protein